MLKRAIHQHKLKVKNQAISLNSIDYKLKMNLNNLSKLNNISLVTKNIRINKLGLINTNLKSTNHLFNHLYIELYKDPNINL